MKKIIAVDAMGGDHGCEVTIPASIHALKEKPDLEIVLVGKQTRIEQSLEKLSLAHNIKNRIHVQHASETVDMDEAPSQALRQKKDSSMRKIVELVKSGKAQACVSAGNTGALMATARYVLSTLNHINRPAIMASFPNRVVGHCTHVLDVGANVGANAQQLYQFAVMGNVVVEAIEKIERPRIGVLNIGVEEIKGNEQVKQLDRLLSSKKALNYIGFVEGNDVFKGEVDVVVCDGFIGNVLLKSIEGTASLIRLYIKKSFNKNCLTRLVALATKPILKSINVYLDPRQYNGASLLGLKGIVVKSHGKADKAAFSNAIQKAYIEIERDIMTLIHEQVNTLLIQDKHTEA